MYSKKTGLVLGFHGCDETTCNRVINGGNLKPSKNDYDWLGNGMYFWETDPIRAMEWAEQAAKRPSSSVKNPAVIGAVIDLGNCLDLTNRKSQPFLRLGYEKLQEYCLKNGVEMPRNDNVGNNKDELLRRLDCAVIQMIHATIQLEQNSGIMPFDSVRGMFVEGGPAYKGAGIMEKTHTQLCIVNPNCIKGYFLPREQDNAYAIP